MGDCRMNVRIGTLYTRRVNRRVEMLTVSEDNHFREFQVCLERKLDSTYLWRCLCHNLRHVYIENRYAERGWIRVP